jgi:lactoylglutathione lyase
MLWLRFSFIAPPDEPRAAVLHFGCKMAKQRKDSAMAGEDSIRIEQVDHLGIRVSDPDRAMAFYGVLGFELHHRVTDDAVIIIKNADDVEINLIVNANDTHDDRNILMDVKGTKYPGFTHVALRVSSIEATMKALAKNKIEIRQGPVQFGQDGHVSLFVRDPDLNVLELRGRLEDPDKLPGIKKYTPD